MTESKKNKVLWARPGFLARRLHQINVAIFLAEMEPWGITPNQWGVLTVVTATPGLSHTEIAAQLGIDRVNVRDILIRLGEKKLVTQKSSDKDRRQAAAFITAEGRRVLEQLEPNVRRAHEILLSPLNGQEKRTFLSLLRRIVDENNELSRAPLALQAVGRKRGNGKVGPRSKQGEAHP